MTYQQLYDKIFDNYDQHHYDILCDALITSAQQADKILAKYDTSNLTQEQHDQLKRAIVQKEVERFSQFVQQNKDVLDAEITDNQKFALLFEKYDNPSLTEKERHLLKQRIHRNIYDKNVCNILQNLVDNLRKNQ